MQLAIGDILEGKVTGITKFGAFVELEPGKTGMVHISEVSTAYVEDISQYLQEGQEVKVKVINITDEGKISLSIKKAMPAAALPPREAYAPRQAASSAGAPRAGGTPNRAPRSDFRGGARTPRFENRRPFNPQQMSSYEWSPRKTADSSSFEDMMNKFKQTSDDKMSDLKKGRGDVKRGAANRKAKPE